MKIGRYILLGIVVALVVFLWSKKTFNRPADYMKRAVELEAVINQALLNHGLSENNLLETYNEQKTEGRLKWVLFTKRFAVPEGFPLEKCSAAIGEAVKEAGGKILLYTSESGGKVVTLKVGAGKIVTHELIFEVKPKKPRIALIIDDFGFNEKSMREFMTLNYPLTFAVLPYLKFSKEAAELSRKTGKEVLLHLPLTGLKNEPNKNVITLKMSREEIEQKVEQGIAGVPGAAGANNHTGSIVVEDTRAMEIILNKLREHNMFFVDSLTSQKTVGYKTARAMGIKTGVRDIFLDMENYKDVNYIRKRFKELVSTAKKKGEAIGIGHNRTWTFKVLSEELPKLQDEGIELVFASQIVK